VRRDDAVFVYAPGQRPDLLDSGIAGGGRWGLPCWSTTGPSEPRARGPIRLPLDSRKEQVISDLVDLFGEDAGNCTDYVEALWPQDQLTGGAYNAYLPPGAWSSFGSAIRESFGRISWAGSETAAEWYGYLEGAATAGERAAEEILRKWL
jgi:monoamine oxidase